MNLVILGAYEFTLSNKRIKVIKMRNPFINYSTYIKI
jgi:hypothetical protein